MDMCSFYFFNMQSIHLSKRTLFVDESLHGQFKCIASSLTSKHLWISTGMARAETCQSRSPFVHLIHSNIFSKWTCSLSSYTYCTNAFVQWVIKLATPEDWWHGMMLHQGNVGLLFKHTFFNTNVVPCSQKFVHQRFYIVKV